MPTHSKGPHKKERTLSVSEFKAKALSEFEEIQQSGRSITITKRGKPIARVTPWSDAPTTELQPGTLRSLLIEEEDVLTPFGPELWQAADGGRRR